MNCPKCNKEIQAESGVCAECGASPEKEGKTPDIKKSKNKKRLLIGIIIAVAVCAAAYLISIFSSEIPFITTASAEDTAKAALEAYLNCDSEKTQSLFHSEYTSWLVDKYYGGDREKYDEMLKNSADKNKRYFEERYGSAWSYSDITVKSIREFSAEQVSWLNEDYDGMGLDIKVKAASKIKLKYTVKYLNNQDMLVEETNEFTAFLINVNGTWYQMDE